MKKSRQKNKCRIKKQNKMTHIRRIAMPKTFPIKRKGTEKYIITSVGNSKKIPVLLILRDILGIAKTKKEAKMLLRDEEIIVNGKRARDERLNLHLFETLRIPKTGKSYKIVMKNRKFAVEEISEKESGSRICKVIGKKLLRKGKIQINLDNGYNILSDINPKVNDSVIFDFKSGKITKHIPLKEKANVEVIAGSHAGFRGTAGRIEGKTAEVKKGSETIKVPAKNVLVIENEK